MDTLIRVLKYLISHAESDEARLDYEATLDYLCKQYKYWTAHPSDCKKELDELVSMRLGGIMRASNYICYSLGCYNKQVVCSKCPKYHTCNGPDYMKALRF